MALNVNRNVSDAFYRYKMPRLQAKVEGKGNGIKTVLVNIVEIAKALGRPPTYPTKFFGCELGAQTQFDIKHDRFIVNGAHEAGKLQEMLDIFIRKFVLCPGCENPETVLTVHAKKQTISQTCKACGYNGQLDMRHKLTTFILKNPPEVNPAVQGSSLTEGKKSKRTNKKTDGQGGSPKQGSENGSENELDESKNNGADDDDDWSVDVSAAAVKARMEDLTSGAKGLTISEDLEKTPKERADLFYTFVKMRRDQGILTKSEVAKEIVTEAERLDVKDKAPLILCELLFDSNILVQMKNYRALLMRFTHENPKAQKALIGGVELLISLHQSALLPKVSHILKALYDYDIVDEEVILEWGSKPSRKYVSKELNADILAKATPFLKWLKEAEEESDESEDDVEIEYDDRARPATLIEQKNAVVAQKKAVVAEEKNEDDEDDVDIDAI